MEISNYRPISLTSVFSKIIEKAIKKRLIDFSELNNIGDMYQFGFQKNSSTKSAVSDLMEYIYKKIDKSQYVAAIFIDLKKAFDTVDHKILLKKMLNFGIRDKALKLIESYLQDRLQVSKINSITSSQIAVSYGVPQGSVLGPLLYLWYILDLKNIDELHYFSYADDTVLVFSDSDLKTLETKMNSGLKLYNSWLVNNKLTINVEKTAFMCFYNKNKNYYDINIRLNSYTINKVTNIKYLGLYINQKLNWGLHIEKLKNKLSPLIGAINRINSYIPLKSKYLLYYSYIYSNLSYLITIWGSCTENNLNELQRFQNRTIKKIFNFPHLTPTLNIYSDTKLLNIEKILKYEKCKFAYNILNGKSKTNVPIDFQINVHEHNTRNKNLSRKSIPKTNSGLKTLKFSVLNEFEKLPLSIKKSSNIKIFSKKCREYFDSI